MNAPDLRVRLATLIRAALILAALVPGLSRTAASQAPVMAGVAVIEQARGEVHVRDASPSASQAAAPGMALHAGQTLVTGASATAYVRLNPKTLLAVLPDSTLQFTKMEKHLAAKSELYALKLNAGAVYCSATLPGADSQLTFETPSATVRVTGTVLSVAVDQAGTTAQALSGAVLVTGAAGSATLTDQTQAVVSPAGAVSDPAALTADQVAAFAVILDPAAAAGTKKPDQGTGLIVTAPPDGFMTRNTTVTVTGSAQPGTVVDVNGTVVYLSGGNKTFSIPVTLVEGPNPITVTATRNNKTDTITLTVIRDTTPPILILTQPPGGTFGSPGDGCVFANNTIQCTLIGVTEPGALLTIQGAQAAVRPDGSFSYTLTVPVSQATITVSAADALGNTATLLLTRAVNPYEVAYLTVTATPNTMTADGRNKATIMVQAFNFVRQPVQTTVNLTATTGGNLETNSLLLPGGTGTALFTAGVGGTVNPVTITATSGTISGTAVLTLTPDAPPSH